MAIKEIKREWSPEQLDYVKHYLLHTESDVKDLPKCCIGSRATVSETDNEYVCADCGWVRADFVGLAAIAPDLLTDPDAEITYDAEKTEIGANEFANNADIKDVCFPNVTSVGDQAFYGCPNLRYVYLPKVKTLVTSNNCFRECASLEGVFLDECVQFSKYTFYKCVKLKKVYAPKSLGGGNNTFQGCTSLEEIALPCATTLGGNDFQGCTALNSVDLPNVTDVKYGVFSGCTALTRIDLPSASSIYGDAFDKVKTLVLSNTNARTGLSARFTATCPIAKGTGYIYVPKALIDSYKTASGWSTYAAQFRAIEDYPHIYSTYLDVPITKGEAVQMVKAAGGFIVNATVTLNEGSTAEGTCTFDKTYNETLAAIRAGQHVVCTMTDSSDSAQYYLPAIMVQNTMGAIFFALNIGSMSVMIQMATTGEGGFTQNS